MATEVRLLLGFLVCFTATTTLHAIEPSGTTAAAPTLDSKSNRSSIEQLAAQGAAAFKAGQFDIGLEAYRQAEHLAHQTEEQAALRMNIGACLHALGRLADAKESYLAVVELQTSHTPKARLNAALIAVELDQLEEAAALLSAVSPLDESLISRAQDVKRRLTERREAKARAELLVYIDKAAKAIALSDYAAAEGALVEAHRRFGVAAPQERLDVLLSLATARLALKRPGEAKSLLESALSLSPADPDLHYTLGRVHEALAEDAEARAAYRRSLALGLKEPRATGARACLDALDPLSPSEWYGSFMASAGYDSNPRQSGAAAETAFGRQIREGSGYGRIFAELGRTQRVVERLTLGARYAGDWLGMQKQTVREFSLQTHGGFIGAQWSPTDELVVGFELGSSATLIGMQEVKPYTLDFIGRAKARYRGSGARTWRLAFEARRVSGATDWDFLSGSRFDSELSHGWRYGRLDVRVGLHGRLLSIGTRPTTVDAAVITACTGICDNFVYVVPLSHTEFGPTLSTRLTLNDTFHLAAFSQLGWRRYRDESFIVSIGPSRKRREDLRSSFSFELRSTLDPDEHFVVVPSYTFIASSSNVAYSSTDSAHRFDYDNRSFVQHLVELGLEASF